MKKTDGKSQDHEAATKCPVSYATIEQVLRIMKCDWSKVGQIYQYTFPGDKTLCMLRLSCHNIRISCFLDCAIPQAYMEHAKEELRAFNAEAESGFMCVDESTGTLFHYIDGHFGPKDLVSIETVLYHMRIGAVCIGEKKKSITAGLDRNDACCMYA